MIAYCPRFFAPIFMVITCLCSIAQAQHKVSGTIMDEKTKQVLFGATVYDSLSEHGAVTNAFGYFVLSTENEKVHLQISFVGYKTQKLTINTTEATNLEIKLKPSINLRGVEVVHRTPLKMEGMKMNKRFIKNSPLFLGENDVLKAAQFLPGVQGAAEGSAGIIVRGGSSDQNLILLDGIPVYNAFHIFGLFSVFSPEVVENSFLLKGAFPARYGGRLSSVLDIQTMDGNKDSVQGSVGLGPIVSHVHLQGPWKKSNKTSFVLSGRRTFLDLLTNPIIYAASKGKSTGAMRFHDFNFKINHRLNARDHLYFSVYSGKDYFNSKFKEDNGYFKVSLGWGNQMGMLRFTRRKSNGVFMNLNAYHSRYKFETIFEAKGEDGTIEHNYFSGIVDWGLNGKWENAVGDNVYRWGGQLIYHTFKPGSNEIKNTIGIEQNIKTGLKFTNLEFGGFYEWERTITKGLVTNIGINANGMLIDSVQYFNPDPRIKVNYRPGFMAGEFSLGYSHLTQYIHLLANPAISLPTDMWISSTATLKPSKAKELSAAYTLETKLFDYEIGAYYKTFDNLTELKEGVSVFQIEKDWEQGLQQGIGKAYGVELSANKPLGKLTVGGSFTYSRSFRKMDEINNEDWFPFKYDRPIYVNQYGSYSFSEKNKISWAFTLSSGNRVTLPEGVYHSDIFGTPTRTIIYGSRNSFVMPIYHRLDVSFETRKAKKRGERIWTFGVINAYNRVNPVLLDTGFTPNANSTSNAKAYSIIPILPSFKWTRTF